MKINVGDSAELVTGNFYLDPSNYNRKILIRTPSRTYSVTPSVSGNALTYTVGSGEFTEPGRYEYQGRLYNNDLTYQKHGQVLKFKVHRNIDT